jgi:hypothetical protein
LLRTANKFGGLEFGRLTFPSRDQQHHGDEACRISGEGEVKLAEIDI